MFSPDGRGSKTQLIFERLRDSLNNNFLMNLQGKDQSSNFYYFYSFEMP